MRLLIATTNRGKIREILPLLDRIGYELVTLGALPAIEPPAETGSSFAENARWKAQYYATRSGMMTVAEDSGLEVDGIGGRPGVESARFGGDSATYPEKFRLVYQMLRDATGATASPARFVCALALADADRIVYEARGTVEGEIAPEPKGAGGFGYDPIFFYPPFGCTLAEAGERKSEVSHRAVAFGKLREYLQRRRLRESAV